MALAHQRRIRARLASGAVHHRDAVHRARRDAQSAADAFGGQDGMHLSACAHDRIHRALLHADRATDAGGFVHERDLQRGMSLHRLGHRVGRLSA
jgi:hypothetical protein